MVPAPIQVHSDGTWTPKVKGGGNPAIQCGDAKPQAAGQFHSPTHGRRRDDRRCPRLAQVAQELVQCGVPSRLRDLTQLRPLDPGFDCIMFVLPRDGTTPCNAPDGPAITELFELLALVFGRIGRERREMADVTTPAVRAVSEAELSEKLGGDVAPIVPKIGRR